MVKGGKFNFLIDDSYTMEVEAGDNDDPSSASSSSSSMPSPQSNNEDEENDSDISAAKIQIISVPENSASPQLALSLAEEKKSDNSISNESAAASASAADDDDDENHEDDVDSDRQLHEELVDAETTSLKSSASAASIMMTPQPQSSNLHDDQPTLQIIKERGSSTNDSDDDKNMNINMNMNIDSEQQQPIQSTMAMVKLRVWNPAAPSRQFNLITATTVMLVPPPQPRDTEKYNTSGTSSNSSSSSVYDGLLSNDNDSDDNLDDTIILSPLSKYHDQSQRRLSMVKEERLNSSGSLICEDGDHTTLTDAEQKQGRRETIKTDNKSIKNNLSQLVEDENENGDDDDGDDDDDGTEKKKNRLQVGNLVGIHLIKNNATASTASSSSVLSTNSSSARNNKQSEEWNVGNSIRVLHNLNLVPSHTTGLEQLLYQIEHNDPSIRELILDGITTTNNTPTPLTFKHLEILIEAIGQNTSIQKCSLQHSQITNEIASMLALALVDNTTMTILSLRGNDLTSVAIKNFYSVLSSNNRTLRVLDISDNPGIENDVSEAFETFMEQRAVKRMLMLKAEKAKRIARGLPLLNEMLEEVEESEDDWRIGSGVGSVKGRRNGRGIDVGCDVTVVCHPDVIDGTFRNDGPKNETAQPQHFHRSSNTVETSYESTLQSEESGSRPEEERVYSVLQSEESSGSIPEEERVYYDSVISDITGIGNSLLSMGGGGRGDVDSSPPLQPQQDLYSPQSVGSELYPQSQQHHHHQQKQERIPSPQRTNRRFDSNYSMTSSQSQISSNDSSTSNTGNESLDQRQRQQLATVNNNNHNDSGRTLHASNRNILQPSTSTITQYSTSSSHRRSSADEKAAERELRRQLANEGQKIGAYAIQDEAPHRQEVRGRRARVSRTESQRRARLSELSSAPPQGAGSAAGSAGGMENDIEGGGGGGIVDADMEPIYEYEYRNMSMYHKFFYRIGLDGDEKKTDRAICVTFGVCIVVMFVAVILYVTLEKEGVNR